MFEDHRGDVTDAVRAVVNDESFLVELRIEIFGKFVQSVYSHIGDIDISDFAARSLVNLLDVIFYPLVMIERIFFFERADHHLAGAVELRFAVERQFRRIINRGSNFFTP